MTWIDFFKAFAGPLATVTAAVAALVVTAIFGWFQLRVARQQVETATAQKNIADQQRAIAFDKLKHDLFDKRYEIYQAAKKLIEMIFDSSPVNPADPKYRELRLKLDEARFFFPPDTRAFCETIENHVFEALTAAQAATGYSLNHPERQGVLDREAKAELALANIYPTLAKRFERDLGFEQLTKA